MTIPPSGYRRPPPSHKGGIFMLSTAFILYGRFCFLKVTGVSHDLINFLLPLLFRVFSGVDISYGNDLQSVLLAFLIVYINHISDICQNK